MKKLLLSSLLLVGNLCYAQINTKFYAVPNENVVGLGLRASGNDALFLLLDTYCYTPGTVVIEGCPRGYHLFRLDSNQDTVWTYPIGLYPDLNGLIIQPQSNKIKIFGSLGPESGECNGVSELTTGYSGYTWASVHNLDITGNYLDSTKFSISNCFMPYRLARALPGNRSLLGTQYYERLPQSPVTYAEARYFVLDSADNVLQSYAYPGKYYLAAKSTVIDSVHTLFIHYNLTNDQYELVKINDQGAELWVKPYQGAAIRAVKNIQKLNNGDIMVQAVYYDNQTKSNVLNRYDSNGDLIWSKEFIGTNAASAVGELDNGSLLYGESLLNAGSFDILLRMLSPAGDSINAKWYAISPGIDNIRAIMPAGNSFYLMGDAFGGLDSIYGPSRAFLSFDDFSVNSLNERATKQHCTLYPNPTSGPLYLQNLQPGNPIKQIKLYDYLGHILLTLRDNFDQIDISNFKSGLYLVEIADFDNKISMHRVIKL